MFVNEKLTQKEKEIKILELALGKESTNELMSKNMSVKSYRNLVQLVMATIQGMTLKEFQDQLNSKN